LKFGIFLFFKSNDMKEYIKLDIKKVLNWIDEDLQKLMIPILDEVNIVLNSSTADESDALFRFNHRVDQYYKEIDFYNLKKINPELYKYLKKWIFEVENRVFEILFSKN